jgi:hypothetical protein
MEVSGLTDFLSLVANSCIGPSLPRNQGSKEAVKARPQSLTPSERDAFGHGEVLALAQCSLVRVDCYWRQLEAVERGLDARTAASSLTPKAGARRDAIASLLALGAGELAEAKNDGMPEFGDELASGGRRSLWRLAAMTTGSGAWSDSPAPEGARQRWPRLDDYTRGATCLARLLEGGCLSCGTPLRGHDRSGWKRGQRTYCDAHGAANRCQGEADRDAVQHFLGAVARALAAGHG